MTHTNDAADKAPSTRGLSRREAIALGAAALGGAATLGLGGCGGDGGDSGNGGKKVVYVYNWGEYIDESVIEQFTEETGIEVVYDTFETNEVMYPIIEQGQTVYDAVCPSDYMIQKMIANNLLAEINFDNIPNIEYIGQEYIDAT